MAYMTRSLTSTSHQAAASAKSCIFLTECARYSASRTEDTVPF